MKKSLIALAVLAASSAAMAQSSVTIYGVADAGVLKDKGTSTTLRSGGLNTSRLGFRGTEDLGGGLAANFLLEQGINLASGNGTGGGGVTFNRQSYVGLSGGFGEIKLGNVYTAYDDIAAGAALGFDSGVYDSQDIFASMGYDSNPGSNFYYSTPSFGGFSGAFSYQLDAADANTTSFHIKYEGGPLYVGLGYQDESDATSGNKFTTLNGSYDFGAFKLLAAYGTDDVNDADDISIGAEIPFGAFTLSAGYAMSDRGAAGDAKGVAIMGTYNLSKRTALYAGYRNDNDVAVTSAGGFDQRVGFGIRHRF